MNNFTTAVTNRRTNYALSKDVSIPQETIIKTIEDMVHEVPSAFNMQSGKVVVAFGETHDKIWQIAMDTLRGIVPAAAYGTVLYFDDISIVEKLADQFPLYAQNFPVWGQQANGMMQFAIWTALTDLGLGVNLQHYNPLIDDEVKKLTGVPAEWKLIAQMPFGNPLQKPDPIEKAPIEERVKIFK